MDWGVSWSIVNDIYIMDKEFNMTKLQKEQIFNEIKKMPEDYEILNCPNCFKKHKRENVNHYILCGNSDRKEIYFLCLSCGKIFKTEVKEIL